MYNISIDTCSAIPNQVTYNDYDNVNQYYDYYYYYFIVTSLLLYLRKGLKILTILFINFTLVAFSWIVLYKFVLKKLKIFNEIINEEKDIRKTKSTILNKT